jgi:hypothetical protein
LNRLSVAKIDIILSDSKDFVCENASFSESSKTAVLISQDSYSHPERELYTLRATAIKNTCDNRREYLRRPSHFLA